MDPDKTPPEGGSQGGQPDFGMIVRSILDHNKGDAARAITQLVRENYKARVKLRELKARLESGALVAKEDAEALEEYRKLGSLDEIRARLAKADELQGQLEGLEWEQKAREAAEVVGFKPSVLAELARPKGLTFEIREMEGSKTAFVIAADGTETELAAFAETHLKEFLPALKADGESPAPRQKWVEQKPGSGGKVPSGNDVVRTILNRYTIKKDN